MPKFNIKETVQSINEIVVEAETREEVRELYFYGAYNEQLDASVSECEVVDLFISEHKEPENNVDYNQFVAKD